MLVFLSWALHAGAIGRGELDRYVSSVRALVAAEPDAGWATVGAALRAWPPWSVPAAVSESEVRP